MCLQPVSDDLTVILKQCNMKHTNLYNEIEMQEPKDHSNFYVGLAVGVMVTVCTIIYGVMSVIS